ncbi:MAG TPA: hypothetical protein VGW12_08435 [Pyrinomonadaceae bacterium]|nr:hypothetical protein [Pyrinomonadaceae bacterium]
MFQWLEQTLGAIVILLVLLDVFLTVLYARAGTGIISDRLARLAWRVFRLVSKPFGRHRGVVLSLCGPVILLLLVAFWDIGLTLGTALVIHPRLGTAVTAGSGETPTDFITALFAGGSSTSIVGAGDFTPQTSSLRAFYLFTSLVGTSIISLTLTYLMQVYTALRRRNAFGLKLHLLSAETADAAELLAGLGPQGKFDGGHNNLSEMAKEMGEVKESHHFYPVLSYFRFNDSYYSMSQTNLLALDTVTLIKSGLNDEKYGWLKESAAAAQLWRASMMLMRTLSDTFLPNRVPRSPEPPDAQTRERWRRRYFAALRRLRQAGIEITADEQSGADIYISLRAEWDYLITMLAPTLAYDMEEIDPAGSRPASADERQEFQTRLSSAG